MKKRAFVGAGFLSSQAEAILKWPTHTGPLGITLDTPLSYRIWILNYNIFVKVSTFFRLIHCVKEELEERKVEVCFFFTCFYADEQKV